MSNNQISHVKALAPGRFISSRPTVSVIIPCYNQGQFIKKAVDSVLSQSFKDVEIIVIDDDSTDNTREVVRSYPDVGYVYQPNRGLSSARNTGVQFSKGEYLVFLDADDWLFDDALRTNVNILDRSKNLAFVSGAHLKIAGKKVFEIGKTRVMKNHYQHFLVHNYVGMIATVMFRRWVFDHFNFDTRLKACEDYDLYLRVARHFPVKHHTRIIANYFFHSNNMSRNIPLMLNSALKILKRQEVLLKDQSELDSYEEGLRFWKDYYCGNLYKDLAAKPFPNILINASALITLLRFNRKYFLKAILSKPVNMIKKFFSKMITAFSTSIPSPGFVHLGDFNRTSPFSKDFGYDRGGPVDRYYIEGFLEENKHFVKGHVLEIGDDDYTERFGEEKVERSEVLHINDQNPKATLIGDLSHLPDVPSDSFDCIILTQTLQLIYECREALRTCHRILKPGGVLLLTVPGISHIEYHDWKDVWLWSFTETSIRQMLHEAFANEDIHTKTYGNVLIASAFLYGMGRPELNKRQLDKTDPNYQVIISAWAQKKYE